MKCELLTPVLLLLDDNAKPHKATATVNHLATLGWERLDHPPYSPDLAPSDFHLFPVLKKALGGKYFTTTADVEVAVRTFFSQQDMQFYEHRFLNLVKWYDKHLNVAGDYV